VPFGVFEEALKKRENKGLASELAAAVKSVKPGEGSGKQLARCRELVMKVSVPKELQESLRGAMQAAGIPVPEGERWEDALRSLKAVWASKYNERAFMSTRKVGISFDDVRMAVLCQRVVPAQYAFVIHTTNPTNGDEGEIYCELVRGLGEAIVSGTVPGAALTFAARKDDLDEPRVLLYPSKSEGMFVPDSLIFRSDSNGEDLEGYAGAGLYDSVTTATTERRKVDYSADPLLTDPGFRTRLMREICKAGLAIEQALGSAQDIEGVVDADGRVTVVQTRPQM
jgi:alpha-glucan,water dikinase